MRPIAYLLFGLSVLWCPLSYADNELSDPISGCKIWNSKQLEGYSIRWSGLCQHGKANGKGSVQWFLNAQPKGRYDGDYVNGKMHGFGSYAMEDGSRYIGEFRKNLRHGQGAFHWADGTRYEGQFEANQMHGKGATYWLDGSYYLGEFQDNRKHGFGQLSLAKGNPEIQHFLHQGQWIGQFFVVEGVFIDDHLILACHTEQACLKSLTKAAVSARS